MSWWPFSRKPEFVTFTAEQLQAKLVEVATTQAPRKLLDFCKAYQNQIAHHAGVMNNLPDSVRESPEHANLYVQGLGTAAQCLAEQLGDDTLWNVLLGEPDDNPLSKWQKFIDEIAERIEKLEYKQLLDEIRPLLAEIARFEGNHARQYEAIFHGRLGELLYHSGNVQEAKAPMEHALAMCREFNDQEGVCIYLNNLVEVARYLGDHELAVRCMEELLEEYEKKGDAQLKETTGRKLQLLRRGEPACRVVCRYNDNRLELDEIPIVSEGKFDFEFVRNRPTLHLASALTDQAMAKASHAEYADAHQLLLSAAECDPLDPNPVYQDGTVLMEMGLYAAAKDSFDKVEQLAPGWFRCRPDRWLAHQIDSGELPEETFQILRALDDGGLPAGEVNKLAKSATDRFPEFPAFWLHLGDSQRDQREEALKAYREGLRHAQEPDTKSRLLCALAGLLPPDSEERKQLIQEALGLEGGLVANATARVMDIL